MPGGGKIVAPRTPSAWLVRWHPQAIVEKNAIENVRERVAIAHAIEKLKVDGPALAHPHQSTVLGEEGSGLRELRPRRGRSRSRPIYSRLEGKVFAVLAVGPEAEIDKAGFERAVRAARLRLTRLRKARVEG